MSDLDAIVIGSGAGGMAAATALAQQGRQVLVLEQYPTPGGFSRSLELDGFVFSPGIHYIGELGQRGALRPLLEGLGLGGRVAFRELDPDGYDRLRIGSDELRMPAGRGRLRERLIERFPHEADGIARYMETSQTVADGLRREGWTDCPCERPSLPRRTGAVVRYGGLSYAHFLDHFVDDPVLRAMLSVRAGDHGMGPARCPAAMHLAVEDHYIHGAWYPVGGARALSGALAAALEDAGGVLSCDVPVGRILCEKGRVVGVQLQSGERVLAPVVVSNADPVATWTRLLDPADAPRRMAHRARRLAMSCSAISLYCAVDVDPRELGLTSGNLWYSETADVDATWRIPDLDDLGGIAVLPGLFVAATTLKDPRLRTDGLHTIEAIGFVSQQAFQRWPDLCAGECSEDYEAYVRHLTSMMRRTLDRVVPGLVDHIVFETLHTPLDVANYAGTTGGAIYGSEKTVRNLGPFSFPIETPVGGLYQCGASTIAPGIFGVVNSGLRAAEAILGCTRAELLRVGEPLETLSCSEASDPTVEPKSG